MKIIALSQVEKNEVHMEGAVGAWKQMPLSNKDGVPVYSYRVFTVEPGIYLPDWGGVRLENMVVVRKEGAQVLNRLEMKLDLMD